MTRGVKGQQARTLQIRRDAVGGVQKFGLTPQPLTPIVLREHKGLCQSLVVSVRTNWKPPNGLNPAECPSGRQRGKKDGLSSDFSQNEETWSVDLFLM